jgi:hypothetical protein
MPILTPLVGSFLSLETSKGDDYIFMGGSTEYEFTDGEAVISVISFDSKLSMVCCQKLDDEENKIVSKIRRISGRNLIAVATYQNIYLLKFDKTKKRFDIVNSIKHVHSGVEPINSLRVKENYIYSIAEGDEYVA